MISNIKAVANSVIPTGGQVWLYGSRARGDAREDSDWDLLILLDKDNITAADEDNIAYPFVDIGWSNGCAINPQMYTFAEWEKRAFTPYYKNVEHDKVRII